MNKYAVWSLSCEGRGGLNAPVETTNLVEQSQGTSVIIAANMPKGTQVMGEPER